MQAKLIDNFIFTDKRTTALGYNGFAHKCNNNFGQNIFHLSRASLSSRLDNTVVFRRSLVRVTLTAIVICGPHLCGAQGVLPCLGWE